MECVPCTRGSSLVTHSRKSENEEKPTGKMDVKGTGSITDLVDNVFIIWRNKIRERAAQAAENHETLTQKEQEYSSMPGALLILDKQRNGEGWEGKIGLDFDFSSNQYLGTNKKHPYNYVMARCNGELMLEEQQRARADY